MAFHPIMLPQSREDVSSEATLRRSSVAETFPVTSFLLLLVIAVYALELIAQWKFSGSIPLALGGGVEGRITWFLGSLRLPEVIEGEYWRLLAAAFLHANSIHLLMNGFFLWDMGRYCEPLISSWKFLVIYVGCALGGSLGSLAYSRLFLGPPLCDLRSSVGASGALCGLLGVLLVYSLRCGQREMLQGLVRWLAYIVVLTVAFPGIDHPAHIGGFLTGCAFGMTVSDYIGSRAASRWRYPGYLAAALVVVSLAFAVWHYLANR